MVGLANVRFRRSPANRLRVAASAPHRPLSWAGDLVGEAVGAFVGLVLVDDHDGVDGAGHPEEEGEAEVEEG